jgi:hypothetical protein
MKPITDLDGHTVRQARKQMTRDEEIKRLNEKIEFLSRTNMLYSDWEHRETQVTSNLIRKGIEEGEINAQLRAEIERLKQRPWVGLTEFQFAEIYNNWNDTNGSTPWGLNQALEAALRSKNT